MSIYLGESELVEFTTLDDGTVIYTVREDEEN